MTTESKEIAERITQVLTHFPKLSHSMLQIGLGPTLPSKVWRPILEEMVIEGEVNVETVPVITTTGRHQSYTIISLAE